MVELNKANAQMSKDDEIIKKLAEMELERIEILQHK